MAPEEEEKRAEKKLSKNRSMDDDDKNVGASHIIQNPHSDNINESEVALGLPLDEKFQVRHKSEYATHSGAKGKTADEFFGGDAGDPDDLKKGRHTMYHTQNKESLQIQDVDGNGQDGEDPAGQAYVPSQGRKCIFNFFRLVGTLLMVGSLISDYSYILK